MKSKLFSDYPEILDEEAFGRDVKVVCALNAESLKASPAHLVELYHVYARRNSQEIEKRHNEIAEILNMEVGQLRALYRIGGMFISAFLPNNPAHDDDTEALADDLIGRTGCEETNKGRIAQWLNEIRKLTNAKLNLVKRRQDTARIGSPHLVSFTGTVNFRPIFDQTFSEAKVDLASYDPKMIGVTPVTLLTINVDDGPISEFHFQMDIPAMDRLISYLEALRKELVVARAELGIKE